MIFIVYKKPLPSIAGERPSFRDLWAGKLPLVLRLGQGKTRNLTNDFNKLNGRNAAAGVLASSHSVNRLNADCGEVCFVSGISEIVVVEDLLTVDFSFCVVHCVSTHSQSVTDRGSDFIGLDEQRACIECVSGFNVSGQSTVTSDTGQGNFSEVRGNVARCILVQRYGAVGVDTEDVVGCTSFLNEVSSTATRDADESAAEVSDIISVGSTDSGFRISDSFESVEGRKQRGTLASASGVDQDIVVSDNIVVPLCIAAGVELVVFASCVSLGDGLEVVGVRTKGA